jgi:hypothetical protein
MDFSTDIPLGAVFVGSLAAFAAAAEIGHAFGLRGEKEANVSTLEAAVLGLLALMLSFTFAMAVTRFDARRDALLEEANAIGTAGLRARLLPAPHHAESLKLLSEYADIRVDLANSMNRSALDAGIARSTAIQERLWREAGSVMAKDNSMVPTGLYIQALNAVFDNQQSRLTAYRHRVPRIIFVGLYGIAAIGVCFAGYASGLERRRWRLPVYIVNLLVALVILLIQDIDRPDSGSVTVDQQPMIDTAKALASYAIDPVAFPPPAPAKASEAPKRSGR